MIRIGISAEFMGAKRNGTATYSRNLLHGLAALHGEDQFYAYLSARSALPLLPEAGNIRPRMVYPYNAYLRLAAMLPLELLRRPVDVLHAQGWGPVWSPCPMVLTVHDIGWESFPEIYPKALALRLSYLVRSSARRAALIIASSRYTANDLQRIYQVPAEKIRVIYPSLSSDIARVEDPAAIEQARSRYGIPSRYILYVGSIEPKKNVHRLIQAYAALRRERQVEQPLVIAGRPLWLSQPILDLPAQLGIEGHVIFTGPARQEDLSALYSGADVFAFLGMYEGFGYPPLEAMACGTPVLAANRTSLPEVLGDAALLADPDREDDVAAGLARLLDDPELRAQLRARGLRRAEQFQLAPHACQVLEVYGECAARVKRTLTPQPPLPSWERASRGSERGEGR
ncbi:MAG TPA: glycosyltransferase family 1 protein [Roseiflexaceae bacterium]|nr:glycosyltransferase family 1 protein [Roseiflexaceae bacterium]